MTTRSLTLLLQQGAITSAGGGYTESILDCLDHKSALALRQTTRACRVVTRGWHAHALRPSSSTHLAAVLKCFSALRALEVSEELTDTVSESEWLHPSDAAFANVGDCVTLRTVDLSWSGGLTSLTLRALSGAPALTALNLTECRWLTDAALAHLAMSNAYQTQHYLLHRTGHHRRIAGGHVTRDTGLNQKSTEGTARPNNISQSKDLSSIQLIQNR
jgi:hypothetical protein